MPYEFRPLVRADLPMVTRWLNTPEVVRWWGDPETELALLTQDLADSRMRQRIVEHRGQPFAYAQAYAAHSFPQPHLMHLPAGAHLIDTFIGEPEMLGCGHGRRYLRLFAEILIAEGAPIVAVDPALDNHRACRAYAAAGFLGGGAVEAATGPAVLMLFPG